MSWLHPHAYQAARERGVGELRFDLLAAWPLSLTAVGEPLRLSSEAFQKKFVELLQQHGFAPDQLGDATLTMQFPTSDEHYCVTACRLETTDGRVCEKRSSSLG
jgi:hypothetical protein